MNDLTDTAVWVGVLGVALVGSVTLWVIGFRAREKRNRDWERKTWSRMTHRGGPIEPPPEPLDFERKGR